MWMFHDNCLYIFLHEYPDYEPKNRAIHDCFPNNHLHHRVHNEARSDASVSGGNVGIPSHTMLNSTNLSGTTNWTDNI